MAIYFKHPDIKGNVTAKGYEDWIELTSCSYTCSRPLTMDVGASGNRGRGNMSIQPVNATKSTDKASALLLDACFAGEGKDVEISMVKQGKGGAEEYLKIKMTNTIIEAYSLAGSGGQGYEDMPSESITFNYTKIEFEFKEHDDTGAVSGNQVAGWDLTANEKV